MVDRLGQQLGNYKLIRSLGSGSFAEVYLGEHVFLKTFAAIKVLHTQLAGEDLQRFLQEAQVIARLKHPHIVRILEFGVESIPFLAMDYAAHGTLRQRHPPGSVVPLDTLVSYVKQVGSALQYAHDQRFAGDQRLVHRDVKPENMLLDDNDEVLLSDFGIAVVGQSTRYPQDHDVAGSAAYMAPEQWQGKPRRASDQYALAVVVYEWLSGDRPFHGTITEVASQHMFVPPPPLRSKVPMISPEVEQVVLRALAKDPDQRFSSVQAFVTALEQASQPRPVAVTPIGTTFVIYDGHTDQVWAVAWSPEGRRIASAGDDRTVQVWYTGGSNAPAGTRLLTYGGHSHWVHAVAWSPDGRFIASASYDMTMQVWDAATGQRLLVCSGHSGGLNSVAWSPDGRFIATGSWDKTVRIWDAASGRTILTHKGHSDIVSPVAWSPDSRFVASAGSDKTVQVWEAMTGRLLLRYGGHSDCVDSVAWSPDGSRIASAGDDETVQVWEALTGRLLLRYTGHTDWVWSVTWSPDGGRIASSSRDKTAQVWDSVAGYPIFNYKDHAGSVNAVAWEPHGRRVASAGKDRTVRLWQAG